MTILKAYKFSRLHLTTSTLKHILLVIVFFLRNRKKSIILEKSTLVIFSCAVHGNQNGDVSTESGNITVCHSLQSLILLVKVAHGTNCHSAPIARRLFGILNYLVHVFKLYIQLFLPVNRIPCQECFVVIGIRFSTKTWCIVLHCIPMVWITHGITLC